MGLNITWAKAGRPRKNSGSAVQTAQTAQAVQDDGPEKWTRDEMRLANNGMLSLAIAVVKQWHLDGEPQCDIVAISSWLGIINMYMSRKHRQNTPQELHYE